MTNPSQGIYLLSTLLLSTTLTYGEQWDHEHHEAHVHGEAHLLIAMEDNTLNVEFHSPAINILGFEHEPTTQAQQQAVEWATSTLRHPHLLFKIPSAARCEAVATQVETPFNDHGEHAEEGTSHSDFAGHYQFQCADLSLVNKIEVDIFKQFPKTEIIEVQSITKHGQQKVDLTSEHNTFHP